MIQFEDYQNMIRQIARRKHQQFPSIEIEDLEGQGALIFVECLPEWDPQKASFSTYFFRCLNQRMVGWQRGYGKDYCPQVGIDDTVLGIAGGVSPEKEYEFRDSMRKMSEEAKGVLKVIFEAPTEILEGNGPKFRAGNLRRKLKGLGWSDWHIWQSFKEIRSTMEV